MKKKESSVNLFALLNEIKALSEQIDSEIPNNDKWIFLASAFRTFSRVFSVCDAYTLHPSKDPEKRQLERDFLSTIPEAANALLAKTYTIIKTMLEE